MPAWEISSSKADNGPLESARFLGIRAPFWGNRSVSRYPSPSRSIGIIDLVENLVVIYGTQELSGKIMSHKDLAVGGFPLIPLSLWP